MFSDVYERSLVNSWRISQADTNLLDLLSLRVKEDAGEISLFYHSWFTILAQQHPREAETYNKNEKKHRLFNVQEHAEI